MLFRSGTLWRGRRGGGDRKGSGGAALAIVIAVVLIAIAWLLSVVIRFALSRSREYLADAGSVELTKNPNAMITALRRIEGRGEIQGATSAVMEMCVDNPRQGFVDLFATHPPIEKRVDALVRFAGGHDPGPMALSIPEETLSQGAQDRGPGAPPAGRDGGSFPSRTDMERPLAVNEKPANDPNGEGGPWGPHRK
jgi:heat shock protein HtpX